MLKSRPFHGMEKKNRLDYLHYTLPKYLHFKPDRGQKYIYICLVPFYPRLYSEKFAIFSQKEKEYNLLTVSSHVVLSGYRVSFVTIKGVQTCWVIVHRRTAIPKLIKTKIRFIKCIICLRTRPLRQGRYFFR